MTTRTERRTDMTKKTFTVIFLLASTLINIVFTIVIITALLIVTSLLLKYGFSVKDPNILAADWMLCFVGGMILSLFLYAKLSDKIVRKYNLADKIDERLTGRRFSHLSSRTKSSAKEEKPKTVMPKSVLPDEEDEWEK